MARSRARRTITPLLLALTTIALGCCLVAPVAAQDLDPGPGRIQAGDKEIVVSLGAERLWAYEGDSVVLTTLVSTGTAQTPELATPIGHWSILTQAPRGNDGRNDRRAAV